MNNILHIKLWLLKHSEDIGGAFLAMTYKLLGGNYSLVNIDFTQMFEKMATDAPSMFLAGFMGGLGGFVIRVIISLLSKKKTDE